MNAKNPKSTSSRRWTFKKVISIVVALFFLGVAGVTTYVIMLSMDLPKMITVEDYEPLLVSEVYDRNGKKIGEFFREKRMLIPFTGMPKVLTNAFIAAEDDSFYEHNGLNYIAIFRAMLANIKAGRNAQGGSTITQQVARSLLLTREKTYTRKIKEAFLSLRMEENLSKEEILYLYLNQIYLGQGAYGVEAASHIYFRKPVAEITLPEAAILAGLPQAPSRYSPIYNPSRAKDRQLYVLKRMAEEGFITEEQYKQAAETNVNVYVRKDYQEIAPFFVETIRQTLVDRVGETMVLDKGIKIYTSLDVEKQLAAQEYAHNGLRDLDKRQGYRGPLGNLDDPEKITEFLQKTRDELIDNVTPIRVLQADGTFPEKEPLNLTGLDKNGKRQPTVPDYVEVGQILDGIVTEVNDEWGFVKVRVAEMEGLIDFSTMEWARKPDAEVYWEWDKIKKPSEALKKGDLIKLRLSGKKFYSEEIVKKLSELKRRKGKNFEHPEEVPKFSEYAMFELEQEPLAEIALLAIDQNTQDIVTMIGGYDFARSQFNRTFQAARQTGSSFKAMVYASALDKEKYTPSTSIQDAPIVYEEDQELEASNEIITKKWKPTNHSHKFGGDILFRNALIRSLNVPTVKIIEDIGVDWVSEYSRRLGIFSPLNMDFTLALGSSGVTLYEMVKVFSQIGRMGKRVHPIIIHKVLDQDGNVLTEKLSLDVRFEEQIKRIDEQFEAKRKAYLKYKRFMAQQENAVEANEPAEPSQEVSQEPTETSAQQPTALQSLMAEIKAELEEAGVEKFDPRKAPPLYFEDPEQLMDPKTAYITTSLLQGAIEEPGGTGGRARALGRPVAGKTGTTSGYFDGWFVGYTPDVAAGVWVGFDEEKTLGRAEVGGRAALPVWLEYMKYAHQGLPIRNFSVPEGIVFANIDNETGKLASASSKQVVRQAFKEGDEPTEVSNSVVEDDRSFFKEDLSQ